MGGYIRVSRVKGRSGDKFLSPRLQRERIEGWAAGHGHDLVDVREDLDVSGAATDRDQLLDLIARIEAGELDGLVVATLDRFGRSLPFAIGLIDRIDKAGGQFVSVADGLDTRTPYGKLALNIMLSIAQFELERIRAQWDSVVRRRIGEGKHPGPVPPYGYGRDREGRLTPDPERAVIVTEVFRRFAAGEGLGVLSRDLAERGVRTTRGALPSRRFLQGVLQNRVYLGEARFGTVVEPGSHPPLTDEVTFRRCQVGSRARPPRSDKPSELAGLIRCQGCRYVMSRCHRDGKPRYRCLGNQEGRTCPAPAFVTDEHLLPLIHQAFFDQIDDLAARATGDTHNMDELAAALAAAELDLVSYRDEPGVIAALGPSAFAEGLRVKVAAVQAAQDAVERALAERPAGIPDATTLRAEWPSMPPEVRNRMLGQVFDAVVVRKHPSRSQRLAITDRVRLLPAGALAEFRVPKSSRTPSGPIGPFEWGDDPAGVWIPVREVRGEHVGDVSAD